MKTYYLYEKTSPKGLKYLGVTSNENPYQYPGSGVYWRSHLDKHGFSSKDVETKILFSTLDRFELREKSAYYSKLFNVVESKDWANLIEEDGIINDFPRINKAHKKNFSFYTTELIEKIINENLDSKKNIFYRNIDGVRKENVHFTHTREEVLEYGNSALDPVHFFENYCKIITHKGLSFLDLRDYQKNITESFINYRFNIVASSRQTGMSTLIVLLGLHDAIFNSEKTILITGTNLDSITHILDNIKTVYVNLPFFLKPGITKYTSTEICFDNGSRIICKTKNFTKGFRIDTLFVNDFAYMTKKDTDEVLLLSTIMSAFKNSKIFISSAPNRINHFYEIWNNAGRKNGDPSKNGFIAHSVYWWEVPGRDENWKEKEIANLGIEYFNQSYDVQFFAHIPKIKVDPVEIKPMIIKLAREHNSPDLISLGSSRIDGLPVYKYTGNDIESFGIPYLRIKPIEDMLS